jgi:hypothetical protein
LSIAIPSGYSFAAGSKATTVLSGTEAPTAASGHASASAARNVETRILIATPFPERMSRTVGVPPHAYFVSLQSKPSE